MSLRTERVAEIFGDDHADALAKWAIDALCNGELPARRGKHVHAAKLPWSEVERGRALMEAAGIPWRSLHESQVEHYRERCERQSEVDRRRKIAEQATS